MHTDINHTVKSIEKEHIRVDIFFHLSSHYIFLFMDCTAILYTKSLAPSDYIG